MKPHADTTEGSSEQSQIAERYSQFVNIYHCDADNVGDQMSGPAQYLWPERFTSRPFRDALLEEAQVAIIGGGQIFEQLLQIAAQRVDPNSKLLAWGAGLPLRGSRDHDVHHAAAKFKIFSTRNYDWRDVFPFVPCASCLSPLFDRQLQPKHEIVVYKHRRKPGPENIPDSIPTFSNATNSYEAAVEFIASGDTVVTSSYHGAYWAQLMGRRVVAIPYNYKFSTFQYTPSFAEVSTWRTALSIAKRTHPLLDEYRAKNIAFAREAENLWNG